MCIVLHFRFGRTRLVVRLGAPTYSVNLLWPLSYSESCDRSGRATLWLGKCLVVSNKRGRKLKVKNDLHSLPSFSTFPEPPFWLARTAPCIAFPDITFQNSLPL